MTSFLKCPKCKEPVPPKHITTEDGKRHYVILCVGCDILQAVFSSVCPACGSPRHSISSGTVGDRPRVRMVCLHCASLRRQRWKETHKQAGSRSAKWNAENPEKRQAHKAVEVAIRARALLRACCERCGSLNSQAHHDDYSKPLEVMWLCPKHHGERHRELRALNAGRSFGERPALSGEAA